MTDWTTPSPLDRNSGSGPLSLQSTVQSYDLGNRVRLATTLAPFLAFNPDYGVAVARMNLTPNQLVDHVTAIGGAVAADTLSEQLATMTDGAQRAVWAGLTAEQQSALTQQGYTKPERPEESDIAKVFGVAGHILGTAVNWASYIPGVGPALHGLAWVADQPPHLYRALQMDEGSNPWAVGGGALIGGIAAAAAIPTGGGSLAALGVLGGGALLGATAGAIGSNPTDWYRAFNASWHGERTFELGAQRKADEMLGDTRLTSLAHDFAERDISVTDIARKFAEKGGVGDQSIETLLRPIAERVAAFGTPEYTKAVTDLSSLIREPVFQDAVETLIRGKISIGRDVADGFGIKPGTGLYQVISGGTDAVFQLAVDPTLVLGRAAAWKIARSRGMAFVEGSEAAQSLERVQKANPGVLNLHRLAAEAVAEGNYPKMRQIAREFEQSYMDMIDYRDELVTVGELASPAEFGIEHFNKWYLGNEQMAPMLSGVGTIKGAPGVVLKSLGRGNETYRRVAASMRAFTDGLATPKAEQKFLDLLNEIPSGERALAGIDDALPADLWGHISDTTGWIGKAWLQGEDNAAAYLIGRTANQVPGAHYIGDALTSISTMIKRRGSVPLMGEDAPREIHALIEYSREMGMPSWARRRTEQAILDMPNPAMRRVAINAWLENAVTMAGVKGTPRGEAILARYFRHDNQAYSLGGQDSLIIEGQRVIHGSLPGDMAMEVPMPDLNTLRRAAATGFMADYLQLASGNIVEPMMNVWRPSVLMRVGFIPRAAGEEMLSFAARGGLGGIVYDAGARAVGRHKMWEEATERARLGLPNTAEAKQLIKEGPLDGVNGVLARMLDRTAWQDPRHVWIDKYATWARKEQIAISDAIRNRVEKGLGLDVNAPFEALAGGTLGGPPRSILDVLHGAPALEVGRQNLASNLSAALLGNPRSWRRMLAGGIGDVRLEAGMLYYTEEGRSLVEATSSSTAGQFDRGYDRENVQRMAHKTKAGEWQDEIYLTHPGEQDLIGKGDDRWANGLHESTAKLMHDPVLKEIWAEHAPRIAAGSGVKIGGKAGEKELKALGRQRKIYGSLDTHEARLVMDEFMGAPAEDSFRTMLSELERVNPQMASAIRGGVPETGMPAFSDVRDAVDEWARAHPGDASAQVINEQIGKAKDLSDALDKMTMAKRRFIAANLKSRSNAPLIRNWDEAYDSMEADVIGKYQHSAFQSETMKAVADPALRSGQVLVYVPPKMIPRISDGKIPTFDDLYALSANKGVLVKNKSTVEKVLEHDFDPASNGWQTLLADRQLADEMTLLQAQWAGLTPDPERLMMSSFGQRILKSGEVNKMNAVVPLAGPPGSIEAWSMDRGVLERGGRGLIPINRELDDAVQAQAKIVMGRARQVMTRDAVQVYAPKMRKLEDGTEAPLVFKVVGGAETRIVPATSTDRFEGGNFVSAKGEPVDVNDYRYFDRVDLNQEGPGQIPWELVGPITEDLWDDIHGVTRWAPKQSIHLQAGQMVPSGDLIRVYRSRAEHVQDAGPGLANAVIVPRRELLSTKETPFKKFVRQTFDGFIGPSVDTLARKPMSFHYFANRYEHAKRMNQWLVDAAVPESVGKIIDSTVHAAYDAKDMATLATHVRSIAVTDGEKVAKQWTDAEALAWLRSHSEEQLTKLTARVDRIASRRKNGEAAKEATAYISERDIGYVRHAMAPDVSAEDFLSYVKSALPAGALESKARLAHAEVQDAIRSNRLLRNVSDEEWTQLQRADKAYGNVRDAAVIWARKGAVADMMHFIDSHELKSQFAEVGRNFLPFWFAEENFLKRWARTMLMNPESIRKVQLGYMGLKYSGIVQSDANGRDFMVIPGSNALQEALQVIPGMPDTVPVGLEFRMYTDSMLPGINSRFGAPQFSPFVLMPMDQIAHMYPEVEPIHQALAGGFAGVPALQQLIPTQIREMYQAMTATDSNQKYAVMHMMVVAQSIANGQGPQEDWTPQQHDKWTHQMNDQTRVGLFAGALSGEFTPAQPKPFVAGDESTFFGIGDRNPKEVLSALYYNLISDFGIEQGTMEYNNLYPDAGIEGIVNPVAFTVAQSTSPSGAQLPATEQAVKFYTENQDYFRDFADAAPWLLPVDAEASRTRSGRYGYEEATINSLRKMRTPDEFLNAILFKQGATDYFDSMDVYHQALEKANQANDKVTRDWLTDKWNVYSDSYLKTHRVFAAELTNGEGAARRTRVIEQMRTIVADPEAPDSPQMPELRDVMYSFDLYQANLVYARDDRSALGRARVDWLKGKWSDYMTEQVRDHPEIGSFWSTILRPESSLA